MVPTKPLVFSRDVENSLISSTGPNQPKTSPLCFGKRLPQQKTLMNRNLGKKFLKKFVCNNFYRQNIFDVLHNAEKV